MQDDIQHRIYRPRRQGFGTRDEIGGGVAQQHVQRTAAPDLLHHRLDRLSIAHVGLHGRDARARDAFAKLLSRGVEDLLAPPGDDQLGTQLQIALADTLAQASATAGDQNLLSC
ncbi:hypothetical protein D3C78_1524020 [compost metagenome]